MRFLQRLFKQNNLPKTKHVTQYAFTVGGVDYYCFDDVFNQPYQRALQAIVYFQEVSMNCDREFLKAHVTAIRTLLNPTQDRPTIEVHKANALNEQLSQRLELPADTELMYKLASVIYFDSTENPEIYEFGYGAKKIELWKKHASVHDFFLQKPIVELLPFLNDVGENLETFHGMMQNVNRYHWESLLGVLSEEQKTALGIKNNYSSAATPQS
jgi:hypothetical protein